MRARFGDAAVHRGDRRLDASLREQPAAQRKEEKKPKSGGHGRGSLTNDTLSYMSTIDFGAFDALTFDCYGTLIDWETGLLAALRPVLDAHGVERDDEAARAVRAPRGRLEAGPYLRYAEVLAGCLRGLGDDLGFTPTAEK